MTQAPTVTCNEESLALPTPRYPCQVPLENHVYAQSAYLDAHSEIFYKGGWWNLILLGRVSLPEVTSVGVNSRVRLPPVGFCEGEYPALPVTTKYMGFEIGYVSTCMYVGFWV
jgi:hypothetical protein